MELTRAIRPWEFISAVGTRTGIFGNESGNIEAWVYPLKLVRDFHLLFHVDGTVLPAETLARTLIVRPESTTIVYTGDTFSVRETLFVPVHEAGAVIALQIDTVRPLEVEAAFTRDFQLEWPGNIGDANEDWDPVLRGFHFGSESGKFDALVGSPSATRSSEEYSSNYFRSQRSSFLLGATEKGTDTKFIVMAASFTGREALVALYEHLSKDYSELLRTSAAYYEDYLGRTVSVHIPDAQIEAAYDWAKISMLQGLVQNPFLGEGLVAGFNTSNDDERPGFAWFFGRDAEWTSFALNAVGDFSTTRSALEFLGKYQRADGKVPHEISQSASFVDWFKNTPYAFASADATPLFIIAVNDYATRSGDVVFAGQQWDNLWRAYGFLQSTYDPQGLAQNVGVGHGWIEGGPLYPAKIELYQASLGIEAVRSLSHIAHLIGKEDLSQQLETIFEQKKTIMDKAFWSQEKQFYSYSVNTTVKPAGGASDSSNKRIDAASVLATVPMWFEQLDADQARVMIQQLAGPDHQTDWGMRILSSHDPNYDPGGYHFGVVWPLFTGWASVGEYRYHRPLPAYSNLRTNALLTFDGSLGHVAEALSGKYYQTLSTGSPHQIWSAAMVVNPLLSGLFGLQANAGTCRLNFAPHVPADWKSFSVSNLHIGAIAVDLNYQRSINRIRLQIQSSATQSAGFAGNNSGHCGIEFSPALSLRAKVATVQLNGRRLLFHVEPNSSDQHITIDIPIAGERNGSVEANVIDIQLKDDFELSESASLPPLGSTSRGVRVLSETWTPNRDSLSLKLSGTPGESYSLSAWNPGEIASVEGAEIEPISGEESRVHVRLPQTSVGVDPQATVVFHFVGR